VGAVIGPIQIGSKYGVIYIAEKNEEQVKDFLMVKQDIFNKLEKDGKRRSFENWVSEKKAQVDIDIYENNIRASINKMLYVEADTTQN
jgi:parvulin-like peptidyl-prolyl isomerase